MGQFPEKHFKNLAGEILEESRRRTVNRTRPKKYQFKDFTAIRPLLRGWCTCILNDDDNRGQDIKQSLIRT